MQKPNILFIMYNLPYPLESGGSQAIFNGIKALKDYANLFVAYEEDADEDNSKIQQDMNCAIGAQIQYFPFKRPVSDSVVSDSLFRKIYVRLWYIKESVRKLFVSRNQDIDTYRIPTYEHLPKSPDRVSFINNIIEEKKIDIIQIEMLRVAGYVHSLPAGIKKVFVHHELGFVREELSVLSKTRHPENYENELAEYKKNEIHLLNLFDRIVTLSPIDTRKLKEAGVNVEISTSFAVVNTDFNLMVESNEPYTLSFVGPSNHDPNYIGIVWFLENCWQDLQLYNRKYHLKIIGKWSCEYKKMLLSKYKGISFLGFVPDLASAIRDTIMIVPIRVGSGIRMKILEASIIGVPFVSTSVGAEGIPVENERDCIIADSPEDFVSGIKRMADSKLRTTLARNARSMVMKNYSMKAFELNRKNIIDQLLKQS